MKNKQLIGRVNWIDLTVTDAALVKEFYRKVVGWRVEAVNVENHEDYVMNQAENGTAIAGICHKTGMLANYPSQWLIYITVENLERSVKLCEESGGKLIVGVTAIPNGKFVVIQDPAGAVCALYEEK